jgi:uncharacterized protein (DUF433 family)
MRRIHDHEAILQDWLAGMPCKEIAAKYGCSANMGCQIAKQRGLKRSSEVTRMASQRRGEFTRVSIAGSPAAKRSAERNLRLTEHAKCHGIKATAAKFGLTEGQIRHIAKRYGWKPVLPLDRQAILADYLAGLSLKDIAAKYGCNLAYPSTVAKLYGVRRYASKTKERRKN